MFNFVLFIYLFLVLFMYNFLSQSAETATMSALENMCLTTVLKIIEKYP